MRTALFASALRIRFAVDAIEVLPVAKQTAPSLWLLDEF
jgi:hypothetical protein